MLPARSVEVPTRSPQWSQRPLSVRWRFGVAPGLPNTSAWRYVRTDVRGLAGILSVALGCGNQPRSPAPSAPAPTVVYRSHPTMGAQVTILAHTADQAAAVEAFQTAFREFDRLDAMLSVWRETSDVSRVNAAAGQHPVRVSAETMEVMARAREISDWTDGKFDVTFGALSGLWKFDHDQDNKIPARDEIRVRLPLVDYHDLVIDRAARTAMLRRNGMRAHLGGIGKGYAVDRAVAILRGRGLRDFMVQAGGDLYVAGRRGERSWRVGIRDPRGAPDAFFAIIGLTNATFSTSGDYERFFVHEGRRYHHIVDPDLGEPAQGCRSVTVMAPDATTADGLSTGVFILGATRGLELIERLEGVGAVIVDRENRVHVSKRLEGRVKILYQPTPGL